MRVYRALTATLAPLARRRFAQQGRAFEAVAGREGERRGRVPEDSNELWVHAASVGELNAARPLIDRLLEHGPHRILVSTLTPTAASLARERYSAQDRVRTLLAPLDRPRDVARWLDRTRPARLLLIETELWPELLSACAARGIPSAIVNARLSARAMTRYRRLRRLFAPLLADIGPVACQSDTDAERFAELGVPAERLVVTGNIKFDPPETPPLPEDIEALIRSWDLRPAWCAGSTHRGEEAIVAAAQRRVLEHHPDALLVLVPRHPERSADAEAALSDLGLSTVRLGALLDGEPMQRDAPAALVVDRLGVLAGLYRHCRINLVGGSLIDGIGGHNLIEAAQAGRPVLTGPHTAEQAEAAEGLERAGGLVRVENEVELAECIDALLADPERGDGIARRAQAFLADQRGALDRTMKVLDAWLDGGGSPPSEG